MSNKINTESVVTHAPNYFVVKLDFRGTTKYIQELNVMVTISKLTEDRDKAQKFLDREYIHEVLRYTPLHTYSVEYLPKE